MALYNEDEQVEAIKRWWKKYGTSLILGVVIGLGLMYGVQYWRQHQAKLNNEASIDYQQILTDLALNNDSAVTADANKLIKDMPKSVYATVANLILAKQAVEKNDLNKAATHLQWVIDKGKEDAFKQVARLRLARILLEEKQFDKAMNLLGTVNDSAYLPAISEVKGDILIAQGKQKEARDAYQTALKAISNQSPMRPILLMKLNSISKGIHPGGLA